MTDLINCGERKIQIHSRIALTDICTRYGIQEGDAVEVFIRKPHHPKIDSVQNLGSID